MKTGLVLYGNGTDYVLNAEEKQITARLRGKLLYTTKRSHHPVCPGDHVRLKYSGNEYMIDEIISRKNKISRPANYGIRKEQTIAANIDFLFVVASVHSPKINTGFVDRILAYSNMQQIETKIILNKVDLKIGSIKKEYLDGYRKIGYDVIETSVVSKKNIDLIKQLTIKKISAFLGNSGVGKSSIINSIDPKIAQKVKETSLYSMKGKHTTKQARLFKMHNGGYLLDTPGIKEFGMWNMDYEDLKNYFPEMYKISSECKYNNCLHINEPGCAVVQAVSESRIPAFRYENYLKIFDSLYEKRNMYFKKEK